MYYSVMKMKKRKNSNPVLSILIGIFVVVLLLSGAYLYGRSRSSESLATLKAQQDLVIKTQTETATSLLSALYQKHLKEEITLDEAKNLGANLLRELRYGERQDGYFWADTTDGINVVLYGKKEVEGTNRWNSYIGGVYHVREIIQNGMKEGGGYTNYYFPRKNDSMPLPKRGYSLLFAPFNWVIGTGYYLEDIKK